MYKSNFLSLVFQNHHMLVSLPLSFCLHQIIASLEQRIFHKSSNARRVLAKVLTLKVEL